MMADDDISESESAYIELPFPWPPTQEMVGRDSGDARKRGLQFCWVQHAPASHSKACKQCGGLIRWVDPADPQGMRSPPCAYCLVNKYIEGRQPGSGRGRSESNVPSDRQRALLEIVRQNQPITVRGVYYLATVAGLVPKTNAGYTSVVGDLKRLRKRGWMPYEWIADNTRGIHGGDPIDTDPKNLFESVPANYRMSFWYEHEERVLVFVEKDALAGVIRPICDQYRVSLIVARGFNSLTIGYKTAKNIISYGKPVQVYYLADRDFFGVRARMKLEQTLRLLTREHDIPLNFECLAIKPEHMEGLRRSGFTRPSKLTARWSAEKKAEILRKFPDSAELDAIPPGELRAMVEGAINRHMGKEELAELQEEEDERQGRILAKMEEMGVAELMDFEKMDIPIREESFSDGAVAPITESDERTYRETHVDEDDVRIEDLEDTEEEEE
jgi:hypothetical protein